MSKVFLRMEKGGDCPECFFRKPNHETCPWVLGEHCASHDCIFVRDTIIPRKLALYEEIIKRLPYYRNVFRDNHYPKYAMECRDIIDRAKKIEEATQ